MRATKQPAGLSLARASSIQSPSSLVNYSKRLPFTTVKGMLVLSESGPSLAQTYESYHVVTHSSHSSQAPPTQPRPSIGYSRPPTTQLIIDPVVPGAGFSWFTPLQLLERDFTRRSFSGLLRWSGEGAVAKVTLVSCGRRKGRGSTGTSPTLLAWDGSSMGTGINAYLAALVKRSWTGEH